MVFSICNLRNEINSNRGKPVTNSYIYNWSFIPVEQMEVLEDDSLGLICAQEHNIVSEDFKWIAVGLGAFPSLRLTSYRR